MKNRPMPGGGNHIVSEWEDNINILFDADDPDFCNVIPNGVSVLNGSAAATTFAVPPPPPMLATVASSNPFDGLNFKVPTTMSLASVHGPQYADQFCSPLGHSSISMSSSLSDLVGSPLEISMDNVLTIEELRQHMGSCFTCGVSWTDDHVSLDCSECGGYSLERPCPLCDGQCGVQWKRDFTMSHACGKARWQGVCPSYPDAVSHLNPVVGGAVNATTSTPASCAATATQLRLAQELCARLEQLSASSHT